MECDAFGICLSRDMLYENLQSTFTHVRAYELESDDDHELRVLLSFPQLSGKEVLTTMQGTKKLVWRADFHCQHYPHC